MGWGIREDPLTPAEQVERWRREGQTLQALARKIRTPELQAEIQRCLAQQAKEARAPKAVTPVVTGG